MNPLRTFPKLSHLFLLFLLSHPLFGTNACTSALIAGEASQSGNVLVWKHRDTSHAHNYVDTVTMPDPRFDYIALFNASDSLKAEAWAGANRSGFAIMNTVAGNLPKNSPDCRDREGIIMTLALRSCVTAADFENLLDTLPKPLGVQTNFGIADSTGHIAYYETSDLGYERYTHTPDTAGFLIRSNFSFSAPKKGGYGHDRYATAQAVIAAAACDEGVTPELLTDYLSREYLTMTSRDSTPHTPAGRTFADKGFIPRPTSAASVVIELTPRGPVMWCVIGYPPTSYMVPATIDSVPLPLRRDPVSGRSPLSTDALRERKKIMKSGRIVSKQAEQISTIMLQRSADNYSHFRSKKLAPTRP